ncbi:hypothetical protein PMZ80_001905 [Knufia obscura]|uniref:Beta-lactamase-related domain-containing protein n=1 Tax=Knufia obscura TaxID=1635080 RepID=A0ABR0RWM9_9EURO|nr:hypothetical protein PMZ80_001905 [Knufia obscura]
MSTTKSSTSDPRIEKALARAIELGEVGIAVAAYYHGKLIVDAVAGIADADTGRRADERTLWAVFSVTKGVTAIAAHIQAERGLLKLDAPISQYWPEFASHGKESTTIEQALSHRAGIPQMPEGVTPELMADWDWIVKKIADFEPVFPPGSANAYHILVWGWIIGEVVRRTDPKHRPFQTFVQEEICDPLGITDFFLGVPDAELPRVAKLIGGNEFAMKESYNSCPKSVFPGSDVHNTKVVQQCVDPGAGGITTASAVAKIFAMVANGGELDGKRLLSKERVASFAKFRDGHDQPDKILTIPVWFGANGFWLGGEPTASDPLVGNHRDIVYSPGAGGSIAWADFRDGLAVAICHNNMDSVMVMTPERTFDPIVKAVREIVQEIDSQS